jgi:hypothetical protein
MILSSCGLDCSTCEFFSKTCAGCIEIKGSTFWAKEMMPGKVCQQKNSTSSLLLKGLQYSKQIRSDQKVKYEGMLSTK